MDIDYGVIIGLISVVGVAGIMALSYAGAYLLGQARGRREALHELRAAEREVAQVGNADRLLVVEGAVDSVSRAIERLAEAQRVVLLEQVRTASASEPRLGGARSEKRNTPA
jgi:hypothetical protein